MTKYQELGLNPGSINKHRLDSPYISVFGNAQVREFSEHIGAKIYDNEGSQPITIGSMGSGGTPYGMGLFDYLMFHGADVKYIQLDDPNDNVEVSKVKGRLLIIADDGVVNTRTWRAIKAREQQLLDAGAIGVKVATYNDLRGVSDYYHLGPNKSLQTDYRTQDHSYGRTYVSKALRYLSSLSRRSRKRALANTAQDPVSMDRRGIVLTSILAAPFAQKELSDERSLEYVKKILGVDK